MAMGEYFTSEHFKLLNKWKGQRRDESNPEQTRAYQELKKAYEVTEHWAKALQQKLFPLGLVEIRKRPTNQGNHFAAYNWAKIYPSSDSPRELAYTVGIDASHGFVVKIDTVGLDDTNSARKACLALRGTYGASPIGAALSIAEGLDRSLADLVDWSTAAIGKFSLRYDEVAAKLGMGRMDDAMLLSRFDGKTDFKNARSGWSAEETAAFCRLARAVHDAGLDWWHTEIKAAPQIRFGRKQPGYMRASGVLGYLHCGKTAVLATKGDVPGIKGRDWTPFTPQLAAEVVEEFNVSRTSIEDWKTIATERPGYWPDQLQTEQGDLGDSTQEPVFEAMSEPSGTVNAFNRIYYGPPGTGKTYELSRLLKLEYEEAVDAVSLDEWRGQFIAERIAGLTWWEGAAAALCELGGSAKVAQLFDHPFVQAIAAAKGRNQNVRQTLWGTLQNHAVEDSKTVKLKSRLGPAVFDKTEDSVWRFAGEWDDAGADLLALVEEYQAGSPQTDARVKRYSFVTFHQSFGYEEFVEGLRPVLAGDTESSDVGYEIREGAFKELCRKARLAPTKRFAMFIDEINRGNISKIFGELITLIELDKREGCEHEASVTLPYSGESFSVPSNVDIIGSMNTADRSLALVDTALRRRFEFVPRYPDTRSEKVAGEEDSAPLAGLLVEHNGIEIDIRAMLERINQRIEVLYDRDHGIGHAYFTRLLNLAPERRFEELVKIFKGRVVPLLEEYFFDDWQKICLVLGDNQKKDAGARFVIAKDNGELLEGLFGSDSGLEEHSVKSRFAVQEVAFLDPKAYVGIYA